MKKVGRNEPCPCGSGKKYKNCHQQAEQKVSKNVIVAVLIALAFIISAIGLYWNSQSMGNKTPGEAPKGKMWSDEHGHWHDVP